MIKEGLVFKNTKGNPCVILKVDDKYCWVFAKTRQGFNCNHYGKWYIEECLVKENYRVLANYETWQKAITIYFADKTEELSQIANRELRDQLEAKEQMIKELKAQLEIAEQCMLKVNAKCHACGDQCHHAVYYAKRTIMTALKKIEELDR